MKPRRLHSDTSFSRTSGLAETEDKGPMRGWGGLGARRAASLKKVMVSMEACSQSPPPSP